MMCMAKPSSFGPAVIATLIASFVVADPATAQFKPSKESLSDLYPGKAYSPYAERSFPSRCSGEIPIFTPACQSMLVYLVRV
jgi:hypothetical protein